MKLKRPASATNGKAGKKRKVEPLKNGKKPVKAKGKEHAFERATIPIPGIDNGEDEEDGNVSEEDLAFFGENGGGEFLVSLDKKGISRTKKETKRLHKLSKPSREPKELEDDLPSIHSHSEDEEDWSSGLDDASDALSDEDLEVSDPESVETESDRPQKRPRNKPDLDEELPYEIAGRQRPPSPKRVAERLPIKLGDGRIQSTGARAIASESEEEESEEEQIPERGPAPRGVEDVATGARFGRPAVRDIVQQKSRKARVEAAKEQLASICQEIMAEPENSLGLLRRLHTFALPRIPGAMSQDGTQLDPTPNDPRIRTLALLSQLAVFKDIVPGYRIRTLTDHEKADKVSQMVQRTRDWEQGLVGVYQNYLKLLEAEVKAKSELDQVALQCMCTLLTSITHFNFRSNIMATIVARLSKKSWDESSELCSNTLVTMLRADKTGAPSLEAVRLLNRMIKERRYMVHPRVLSCLLHLRLKTELGVRANREKVDREEDKSATERGKKWRKGKKVNAKEGQVYLSKKAKKNQKANKEIEAEMAEATAEVDKEERAQQQTETLKLLFVLYFRVLKHPRPTPLLPAALEGISRYAHMVNVDFFKDLLQVLKELIERGTFHEEEEAEEDEGAHVVVQESEVLRQRLLCISTAFELLSGQGEALNIDLNEFVQHLYSIIIPLSLSPNIETSSQRSNGQGHFSVHLASSSDLLFRALGKVFTPRTTTSAHPPWRVAAFTKRLLTAATHFPPTSAARALEFVLELIAKHSQLDALLETDDRAANGVYRPDVEDPQLANAFASAVWEVQLLASHWDSKTREAAVKISRFVRT